MCNDSAAIHSYVSGGTDYLLKVLPLDTSPNPSKTWLVTKEGHFEEASKFFDGSGVSVTPKGRPYLGAAIGSQEYVYIEEYTPDRPYS